MGDKSTARETMKNAGVPTVPGSDGLLQVSHFPPNSDKSDFAYFWLTLLC